MLRDLYRWTNRHYEAAAYGFGLLCVMGLMAAVPILFAR